jgi:hypothetical protein
MIFVIYRNETENKIAQVPTTAVNIKSHEINAYLREIEPTNIPRIIEIEGADTIENLG